MYSLITLLCVESSIPMPSTPPRPKKNQPITITAVVSEKVEEITMPEITASPAAIVPAADPVVEMTQGAEPREAEIVHSENTPDPTLTPEHNTPATDNSSTAAGVLADGITAPIAVPAPRTAAQLAADSASSEIHAVYLNFYGKRPQAAVPFIEPDAAALKARRLAYITAHDIDMTDMDALMEVGVIVKAQIDSERSAYLGAKHNQNITDQEWLRAYRAVLSTHMGAIDSLFSAAGGVATVTTKTRASKAIDSADEKNSSTSRARLDWAKRAPKMIAYAESLGLAGVYVFDRPRGGYKDIQHCTKLHADGRWEICTFVARDKLPTPTGEFVASPLYYGENGLPLSDTNTVATNVGGPMRYLVVATIGKNNEVILTDENECKGATTEQYPQIALNVFCDRAEGKNESA